MHAHLGDRLIVESPSTGVVRRDGEIVGERHVLDNRLGLAMTNTQALTERTRPSGTNNLFVAWETLTHGDNPA